MKKVLSIVAISAMLLSFTASYAAGITNCPKLSDFQMDSFTINNVENDGPSDKPQQYPNAWDGALLQFIHNQPWLLFVGYSVENTQQAAYNELKTLYPELSNRNPSTADTNGVCLYKLSPNGRSGAAANYVAACLLGAPCSSSKSLPTFK